MKRTDATKRARIAAELKGITLERLANLAIINGEFPKHGIDEEDGNYSFSWIDGRLRQNDIKTAVKLEAFSLTI